MVNAVEATVARTITLVVIVLSFAASVHNIRHLSGCMLSLYYWSSWQSWEHFWYVILSCCIVFVDYAEDTGPGSEGQDQKSGGNSQNNNHQHGAWWWSNFWLISLCVCVWGVGFWCWPLRFKYCCFRGEGHCHTETNWEGRMWIKTSKMRLSENQKNEEGGGNRKSKTETN